jgi:hypothetical protein
VRQRPGSPAPRRAAARAAVARCAAGLGAAGLVAAGCVAIETAPGGVQSMRLENAPPSVVAGDVLRDSAGVPTALVGVAFDADGRPAETARVRYTFVPAAEVEARGERDTALVVDSVTGVVRATRPLARPQGRVAASIGERLQLVQVFQIVPAPDSVVAEAFTPPVLRYDCSDPGTFPLPVPDEGDPRFQYNTVRLPRVTVRGDSAGQRVGIRARLVRWDVDSGPFPGGGIPRVPAGPGRRDSVPAIFIAGTASATPRVLDTTSATGVSGTRLRIVPAALGRDVVPAREFTVRVRARGQPGPQPLANGTIHYRIRLERTTAPIGGATATCP